MIWKVLDRLAAMREGDRQRPEKHEEHPDDDRKDPNDPTSLPGTLPVRRPR